AIAEPFKKLIPFDRLAVTVLERDSREWAPRYAIGTPIPGFEPGDRTRRLSPTSSWSSITPSPVIVNRGDADVGPYGFVMQPANRVGLLSALFVPMTVNGEIIGVLSVRSSRPNAYGQKHLELSRRIGAQIAGAVANAELHRALADNESRTRAVVETAAVGIVTADSQLIMQSVNDAILEMFGYRREELIGQNVMILANPAFRDTHRMYVKEYLENGMHHMFGQVREVNGTRKSGLAFPMELEVTEINLAQGRTYTAIIRDVTDRRLAEDEISELNAELERRVIERTAELQEANAELEAFSYMVSHDLRGPLGMSASLASRLLDSKEPALPEHARKYVELIAQSSAASADLVADLLNFARVGHQSLMVQQVDLEEIAVSVQAEFADRFPDVKWTLNPLPLCEADPGLLRAVFTNLLSNAYKFTASEPEPSIEVGSTSVDGGLVYYVRDNGVGFDMDGIDKVFKVFERLHRPEDYSGTGAGLAIVQRIIERHGGQIWAESKVGAGATFFFTLPQANGSPSAGMHDQDT
ncbi:MAG: PAS domain S-box protein, partial [Dehalococcoidia bacterium]|nr:PAS domain S-box protein [Dehalococcoidia bacterium]